MKTKSIITLSTLLVISMLSMACGLTFLPVTEGAESPVEDVPAPVVNEVPIQVAARPETTAQSQVQAAATSFTYPIVDTDQEFCYDNSTSIDCPSEGEAFFGQDAQYSDNQPCYQNNGDGTVTDLVTGLMWQRDPGEKVSYSQALAGADSLTLGGYTDWRLPTIKELYSLIDFGGTDVSRCADEGACQSIPFIDTDYFDFEYGDTAAGERMIDSQWATNSIYTGSVMNGQQAMFGVNFADGRIKGYGVDVRRDNSGKAFFVIYARGNTSYGINDFVDNGNGTITDNATGLTWTQNDSSEGLNWEGALNYCESLDYAGISDWRLPNAKELQSIVDYGRSPDATNSAAIDPVFNISTITNEAGQLDYPAFWSSTTHASSDGHYTTANYVAFGRALGYMNGQWIDVHGAGAQRSEDKSGDPSRYSTGHGPQGDAVRIYNYVRCVAGNSEGTIQTGGAVDNTPDRQSDQAPFVGAPQGQPQQGQGQGGGQPPQAAIDACSTLSQGENCSVDAPNGALTGSCTTVPTGQLACVPTGGSPGGGQP